MHSGPFGCRTKLGAKRAEVVQKFVPRSRVRIFYNERIRSTQFHRKLMFRCVSYNLGAFVTVWLPYETRCKMGRSSAKVRATKSHRIFLAMNAPDPSHWTLNSCFGAFRIILVHWGPFGYVTKLGAKRAELAQKFVVRSHIEIFRNERTRSTPLDPKLMFWCLSDHLGAIRTVWLPYESSWKTSQTSAKVRAMK